MLLFTCVFIVVFYYFHTTSRSCCSMLGCPSGTVCSSNYFISSKPRFHTILWYMSFQNYCRGPFPAPLMVAPWAIAGRIIWTDIYLLMKGNYLCALLKDVAESSISRVICRDMFRKCTKMALLVKERKNSSVQRLTAGRHSNMLPS